MKMYKILIPMLLLKNNCMGKYGDEVAESQLTDSVENLINGGYIEEVKAPEPSAADLQKLADEAKKNEIAAAQAKELSDAKDAVNSATAVLENAKLVAASAAPESKDVADAAVANAQVEVDNAQKALDALTAPAKPKK